MVTLVALYPINEVYFGRTPQIQKLASQFSKFRSKYVTKNVFRFSPLINQDEDLIKFNRMMEETFGFSCFSLIVINSSSVNAMTIPVSSLGLAFIGKGKLIEKTSSGIRYKKELGVSAIAYIYTGLLERAEFSDDEIFAILLHEIGHNFQDSLSKPLTNITVAADITGVLTNMIKDLSRGDIFNAATEIFVPIVAKSNALKWVINFLHNLEVNNKTWVGIVDWYLTSTYQYAKDLIQSLIRFVYDLIPLSLGSVLFTLLSAIINNTIGAFSKIAGIEKENIADSFATMYGYGPELSSALYKFQDLKGLGGLPYEVIDRTILLKNLIALNNIPYVLIGMSFNEHPSEIARAANMADTLRYELENNKIDPKMKKTIEAEIKKIEKNTDEFISRIESGSPEQRDMYANAFQLLLSKTNGGYDNKKWVITHFSDHKKEMDKNIKELPITNVKLK